jgi:hypothetical protein
MPATTNLLVNVVTIKNTGNGESGIFFQCAGLVKRAAGMARSYTSGIRSVR